MLRLSFRELGGTVRRIQKVKKLANSRPPKVILGIIDFINIGPENKEFPTFSKVKLDFRKKYFGVRKSREFLIFMVIYIYFSL